MKTEQIGWVFFYAAPLLPFLTRGVFLVRFRSKAKTVLSEEELDPEVHRSYILAMTGFSFTGLLGLAVVDAAVRQSFRPAVYQLLLSFLCYFLALHLQAYKGRRWEDQLGTALTDTASLCLILAIIGVVSSAGFDLWLARFTLAVGLLVWGIDHVVRLRIHWSYLKNEGEMNRNDEESRGKKDEKKSEMTFEICPKHGVGFPKGGECHACRKERSNQAGRPWRRK